LYLKNHLHIFDPEFVEVIKETYLEKKKDVVHEISRLHLSVVNIVKSLGINFKIEQRFYGLDVDLLLYDRKNAEPVGVLEVHGLQHFLRNVDALSGDSLLKKKIIESIVGETNYFEVHLETWTMLADKDRPTFLRDLLHPFIQKEGIRLT
jgi:hypothetical protein